MKPYRDSARRRRTKPRVEFSKMMVIVTTIIIVIVTAFVLTLMWVTQDAGGIEYIVPSVLTFGTFIYRQYYVKAAQENQIKLKRQYGDDYIPPRDAID